jgi:hypothetical protein
MFLNIITPCSRPENLIKISESINIPKESYRWIVVFDSELLPDDKLIPNNCDPYTHKDLSSISGNAQRNYALNLINDGFIYFNDDDTLIHPNLWESVNNFEVDFISFIQLNKHDEKRLIGNFIEVGHIDSHNFMVTNKIAKDVKFILDKYDADGYFAKECYQKSITRLHINKPLSIYNSLKI